jgi:ABC-type transporter Mla subunit MlaD
MAMDEALTRLITRASTLISAIDGVTDQFADEISELKVAMSDAQDVLNAPRPELKQRQGLKPRMRPRM